MKLLLTWALSACALLLVAYLYPGVQVVSFVSALIAAAEIARWASERMILLATSTLP